MAAALVAVIVLGLLATGVAYGVLSTRHAERLTGERDKALAASAAAEKARRETDDQRRLAEEARDAARREERRARAEQANTEAVLAFFLEDVLGAIDPDLVSHPPSLLEMLHSALPRIPDRFRDAPSVAARVRGMIGDAFEALGDYSAAERELRAALAGYAQSPAATPLNLTEVECALGASLHRLGRYEEAEAALLRAEARPLADDPGAARALFSVYTQLTQLYFVTGRFDRCARTIARQLELASDERERLVALGSRAALLIGQGRQREALPELDALLTEAMAVHGEDSSAVSSFVYTRGQCRFLLGDLAGAEEDYRRGLAIQTRLFGRDHSKTANVMAELAWILVKSRRSSPEAEDLARRSLAILRTSSNNGLVLSRSLQALSMALQPRLECAEAEPYALEALAIVERHLGRGSFQWAECAENAVAVLACNGKPNEAEQLLDQITTHPYSATHRRLLWLRAGIEERRGNLEAALELYDQAIALRSTDPRDAETAREPFTDFAALLRKMGDEAGAVEVERQAAELLE